VQVLASLRAAMVAPPSRRRFRTSVALAIFFTFFEAAMEYSINLLKV
jgi:hypothetical protein